MMTRLDSLTYRLMSRRAMRRLKKAHSAITDLWFFLHTSQYQSDVDAANDFLLREDINNAQKVLRLLNDMADASRKGAQR